MKCLKGGCPLKISENIVNQIVDENHKKKYLKFYHEQYKLKKYSNKIMNCPYPNCEEMVMIDPKFEDRFYKCDNNHNFCSVCKNTILHNKEKCSKVNKNF